MIIFLSLVVIVAFETYLFSYTVIKVV